MKHLKTFEQYDSNSSNGDELNEDIWGSAKKWATGHESNNDKEEKKSAILGQLDNIEAAVNDNPSAWQFDRARLEKSAAENNYRGELRAQRGGRDTARTYVVWDNKASGFEDIAGAASNSANRVRN